MDLTLRCHYCSDTKTVKCDEHSANAYFEAAKKANWPAYFNIKLKRPCSFCSDSCEYKHRIATKTHLTVVGSFNR